MDDANEQIRLHLAGATVTHKSNFEDLPTYKNTGKLTQDFIKTWAIPFYTKLGRTDTAWSKQLVQSKNQITKEIVLQLLGDFNWRTRQTGAFFTTIMNFTDLTDIIGSHFLKSEVCYAGRVYARTFASFNTDKAVTYLDRYLAYYLTKTDLWFDQQDAIEALTYLDKVNSTNLASKHSDNWIKFIANKPYWEKNISTEKLEAELAFIENVRQSIT